MIYKIQLPVYLLLFNDSFICTRNYCVDALTPRISQGSIVQAHSSGEVGNLCTFLLRAGQYSYQFSLKSVHI